MSAHHFVVFDLIDPAIGGTRMIFCDRCGIVRSARQENPEPAGPCIEEGGTPLIAYDRPSRYDLPSQMPDTDPVRDVNASSEIGG